MVAIAPTVVSSPSYVPLPLPLTLANPLGYLNLYHSRKDLYTYIIRYLIIFSSYLDIVLTSAKRRRWLQCRGRIWDGLQPQLPASRPRLGFEVKGHVRRVARKAGVGRSARRWPPSAWKQGSRRRMLPTQNTNGETIKVPVKKAPPAVHVVTILYFLIHLGKYKIPKLSILNIWKFIVSSCIPGKPCFLYLHMYSYITHRCLVRWTLIK